MIGMLHGCVGYSWLHWMVRPTLTIAFFSQWRQPQFLAFTSVS